ncbi:histidine kinase [Streptomyces sp. NBC_01619]|uniref:histidine kinase n=1 Tax=Streptomyces sp. NBC_01619 TaxID=2975901 RepID=UPI0022573D93|nr:histidine kinase [Streptomyces sp. NBC_01619]MCX4512032.1 histidine kinase [Streptomyces sp. NBC_01619]
MDASRGIRTGVRAGWQWVAAPELWSRRRLAGESVVALVLGLMGAALGQLLAAPGPLVLGEAVTIAVLSLMRRRLPATVLTVTAALAPVGNGFLPLLLVVGWSAGHRITGARRAVGAFIGAYVLCVAFTLVEVWSSEPSVSLVLFTTLLYLAMTVMPGLASRYWTQRRTLLRTLQERNGQLLRERAMVAGQARLRERQRIAQDMHDSLGHQLALISVHTGALEVDRELTTRQREAVGVLREASVTAMHELREVVGILRDGVEAPAPESVDESGRAARGTAGIADLVESAKAAGSMVELRHSGEARPLAAAADHAAYRIAQEALTNAFKHAPGAAITVELRYEPDSLVVEIVNGAAVGTGGEVVSGGQGLTGLYERARLVGGMVHAGAASEGGFRVAGVLPYGVVEAVPYTESSFAEVRPSGDVAVDARWQSPGALAGNGLPAMDWSVREGEREWAMGRGARGSGVGGVAVGCGIAVAAVALLGAAALFGVFFMVGSMDKGMIEPAEYEAIEVGMAEKDVRDQLPSGDTIATAGLGDKGPEQPKGSRCLVLLSSEPGESWETEPVFRFCFEDGKLVEKKSYEVKR